MTRPGDEERTAFEAAHILTDLNLTWLGTRYVSDSTERCWYTWQQARASLPAQPEGHRVTIHGRYDADSHCVTTSHGEPLVAFETDAGSLAPLDGKRVTVTVRGE